MPRRPKIRWDQPLLKVGCIMTPEGLPMLARRDTGADLIEVRVDSLHAADLPLRRLKSKLRSRRVPTMITLRTRAEGGVYSWKSSERILLFQELLPLVDAVDLELANLPYLAEIHEQARRNKVGVILSAHSINRKITYGRAIRWLESFIEHPAKVYKLAALARTSADLRVLARVLIEHPHLRLAVMGLGPQAAASRAVLPALGSKLVYGWLDEPAAEGQPSLDEVIAQLESMGI